MICTEQEAKKKWCPNVRLSNDGNSGDNRSHNSYGKIQKGHPGEGIGWNRCIASNCMMWEWTGTVGRDAETGEEVPDILGFCGLTGTKA